MKLKKIFLVLTVTGLFFSCTNETLMNEGTGAEGGGSDGLETTVDIQLPTGEILTRGLDPETGLYATENELEINDCMIAIFNTDGLLAGYKRVVSGNSDLALEVDGKEVPVGTVGPEDGTSKLYTISNVTTRHGKDMTILVIANSEKQGNFPSDIGVSTYADYKKIIEMTVAFQDSELVKFGTINTDIIPQKDQSYEIPLTQLSARIDLKLELGNFFMDNEFFTGNWDYDINSLTIYNVRHKSLLLDPATSTGESELNVPVVISFTDDVEAEPGKILRQSFKDNGYTFYTYEKPYYSATDLEDEDCEVLKVIVNVDIKNGDNVIKGRNYQMILNPKGLGPQGDRDGLLHGNLYEITAKLNSVSTEYKLEYQLIDWVVAREVDIEYN